MNILTVSQLNRYISFKFKEDIKLRGIMVQGEISNFNCHRSSGHCYFTLKDRECAIKAVMFSSYASLLKFMPENGMSVIVQGSVNVYERDGAYQLYVNSIQPDGTGALYIAYEQLKNELSEKGLFDEAHKLPLPSFPKKIGVATAEGGAALQDIINVLGRRYPIGELLVFPTTVQGAAAPQSICDSISKAQAYGCDLLIAGRGGGSLEDLNAFNSREVAYAAYNCSIPIISAVGHETDFTILDFVADLRAPTPSAAAELAAPSLEQLHIKAQTLEDRLVLAAEGLIDKKEDYLDRLTDKIKGFSAESRLAAAEEKRNVLSIRMKNAFDRLYESRADRLNADIRRLEALSPLKVLGRGYSLVYSGEKLVKSAKELECGGRISLVLGEGRAEALVEKLEYGANE